MILCNYVSYGTNACESKLKHYFSSFQMDWFTSKLKKSPISYQSASSQPNKTKLPKLVFDCGKIPQARTQEPTRTVWNRNVLLLVATFLVAQISKKKLLGNPLRSWVLPGDVLGFSGETSELYSCGRGLFCAAKSTPLRVMCSSFRRDSFTVVKGFWCRWRWIFWF